MEICYLYNTVVDILNDQRGGGIYAVPMLHDIGRRSNISLEIKTGFRVLLQAGIYHPHTWLEKEGKTYDPSSEILIKVTGQNPGASTLVPEEPSTPGFKRHEVPDMNIDLYKTKPAIYWQSVPEWVKLKRRLLVKKISESCRAQNSLEGQTV